MRVSKLYNQKYIIYKRYIKRIVSDFIFTRYTSFRKILNLFLVLINHYIIRGKKVYAYPIKITVDPTSYCNLRCPLCPTGRGDISRTKGFMSFDTFKKIIDELKDFIFVVDLFNWGEPFLNKQIFDFISYAHSKRIKTRVSTNLNFFKDDFALKLIESGLDELVVSIDGASEETYSRYRIGGNFAKVMNNLERIVETKRKMKSKKPKILWQFIIMKHNESEIEKAVGISKRLGIEISFIPTRADMGEEVRLSDEEKIQRYKDWFPSQRFSRYNDREKKIKPKTCLFLWTQGTINWDGSVSGCCAIYPQSADFGNIISDGGFMRVWNNQKFQYARYIVKNRIPDESVICSGCIKNGFIEP
ncbi:MAG: radical SAM protein [bacterium]|nr:radical SAM protein [bacterium]